MARDAVLNEHMFDGSEVRANDLADWRPEQAPGFVRRHSYGVQLSANAVDQSATPTSRHQAPSESMGLRELRCESTDHSCGGQADAIAECRRKCTPCSHALRNANVDVKWSNAQAHEREQRNSAYRQQRHTSPVNS